MSRKVRYPSIGYVFLNPTKGYINKVVYNFDDLFKMICWHLEECQDWYELETFEAYTVKTLKHAEKFWRLNRE